MVDEGEPELERIDLSRNLGELETKARAEAFPRALPCGERGGAGIRGASVTRAFDPVRIGLVATSDRASQGVYRDEGIPALEAWLAGALHNPIEFERRQAVLG